MKNMVKRYFTIKQIDEAKTIEESDILENHYITKLKPHYNILSGGMKKL
jgi:excinuclease UvrABC nuclease subunit